MLNKTGNIESRSRNHPYRGKAISITHSVTLVIQHAKLMSRIILSSVACLALSHFSTLSQKGTIFGETILLNIRCVFWFLYIVCPNRFSFQEDLSEISSETYKGLHLEYPLFLSDFNGTWIFATYFRKSSNIKFHENSSGGSRDVPCRQTGR
jgi:hypothetical protein